MVEVCDPRLIGLDLLTTSECMIDLGRGVLWVGLEELPLRDVSMDENVELEAPDHVTIPLSTEAIVPAQWWAHPNWREPCGMVEPLAGQTISDLVVGHALMSTKSPIVAVKIINLSSEPHTTGRGTKVAGCIPVVNIAEMTDKNNQPDQPQSKSLEL